MTITSSPVIAALVTFASAALVTTGVVPIVRRGGLRWGLIDRPDPRKQHTTPMVRLGGIGIVAGFYRRVDAVVMRIMDAIMSIPGILLAVALVSINKPGAVTLIVAITLPEIPRVVRVVRSVVLSVREQTYVEAAIAVGTRPLKLLVRHVLPNVLAPLIVQGTFICALAVILEASLSFLGAGTPPETPSWGNMMAGGRTFIRNAPWILLCPGMMLGLTVLSINLLGDGLRDALDPRMAGRRS